MTDARNVYPRLCWGCLGIINDEESDHANLNYGGRCDACTRSGAGDLPLLRDALQGFPERMNSVIERDVLLERLRIWKELEQSIEEVQTRAW